MRRFAWTLCVMCSVSLAPTLLVSQEMVGRRASLFDLGIYSGGAWTSDWFEVDDEGFGVGAAPIFGLTATYWMSPTFGIRANGAYMPSKLPEGEVGFDDNDWLVNNWFYDLDLVFRPWMARTDASPFMSSTELFIGAGATTANIAGEAAESKTSVAVQTGARASLFDLGPTSSVFGELGVRGYPGPVEEVGGIERKFTFTVMFNVGVNFGFGAR